MNIKRNIMCLIMVALLLLPNLCLANDGFRVEIDDVDTKAVAEFLLKDFVGNGYTVLSTSEYQVAVRKDVDDFWAQVFLGSNFNTVPERRVYFNLIKSGNKTCVTAEVKIVTNPNSGFEKYTIITNNDWQQYLDKVKQYFNGYVGYGLIWDPKKKDNCLKVTFVASDSPASKAGVKVGDFIAKVKGTSVEDLSMKKINEFFYEGAIGTTLPITIKMSPKEKEIMLTKDFVPPIYKKPVSNPPSTTNTVNKPIFGFKNGEIDLEGNMPIISVTPGSSADREGIKSGDKILRINGILVSNYKPDTFDAAFAGGEGTKVELVIMANSGTSERTVTLVKTYIIQKNEL